MNCFAHEIVRQAAAARSAAGRDAASYRSIQPPVSCRNGQEIRWGKATDDWTNASGNGSYVTVNPCRDRDGTGADTTTTHTVRLPRPYAATGVAAADPNVRSGQVLAYVRATDGDCVAVSGYLDAPIGTIRLWTDASNIPPGWALCDGDNGTEDLRGRFVVGYDDGEEDYDAVGDAGGYIWHGMTENNHPDHQDHYHAGAGYFGTAKAVLWTSGDSVDVPAGAPMVNASCEAMVLRHGGIVNDWPAQNPAAEAHAHADTDNRPPFRVVVFIQRVD